LTKKSEGYAKAAQGQRKSYEPSQYNFFSKKTGRGGGNSREKLPAYGTWWRTSYVGDGERIKGVIRIDHKVDLPPREGTLKKSTWAIREFSTHRELDGH